MGKRLLIVDPRTASGNCKHFPKSWFGKVHSQKQGGEAKNHKYYFLFMGQQPTGGGRPDLNLKVNDIIYLGQDRMGKGDSDPPFLFSVFASGTHVKLYKSSALCTVTEADLQRSVRYLDEIKQGACWEAHVWTTEKDNDSSPSCLNLYEAAWHCTALKALWRDANTARDE